MARVEDVTGYLIRHTAGPGEHVKRVQDARPAFNMTPTLIKFMEAWRRPSDKTVGHISNPLAYAKAITGPRKSYHANMARLIKGGSILLCEVQAPPPPGSNAHRETPYSSRFYFMKAGPSPCPTEIEPSAATLSGGRRRRRR